MSKLPDECAATGQGHSHGPHGPGGSIQCQYCGESPVEKTKDVPIPIPKWVIISPDGQTYVGETAHSAAGNANRSRRSHEEQSAIEGQLEIEHAAKDLETAETYAHLNCPLCGGSGHIDDAQATLDNFGSAVEWLATRKAAQQKENPT